MHIIRLATLQAIYPCSLEPSLDNLEQGSVRDFDLSVSLRVCGGEVVVSYS